MTLTPGVVALLSSLTMTTLRPCPSPMVRHSDSVRVYSELNAIDVSKSCFSMPFFTQCVVLSIHRYLSKFFQLGIFAQDRSLKHKRIIAYYNRVQSRYVSLMVFFLFLFLRRTIFPILHRFPCIQIVLSSLLFQCYFKIV